MNEKLFALMSSLLKIANKQSETVPFVPNIFQRKLLSESTGRDIILKARQVGISSVILAKFFLKCISTQNTRAVVISHDRESTQRLLARVHFFLRNLPIPVKTTYANKNEITFEDTNSTYFIGTAGARRFGRGDTITDLHISELAFWEDPSVLNGLLQAVPITGYVSIESTANGRGNEFHRRWEMAKERFSTWKAHFYSWLDFPEYSLPVPEGFEFSEEEREYQRTHGCTNEQLYFRHLKMEEFSRESNRSPEEWFMQEYPANDEEAFLATGTGVFSNLNLNALPLPKGYYKKGFLEVFNEPQVEGKYVIGVDPAEGLRKDRSAIEVLRIDTLYPVQCAEYNCDNIPPDELAEVVAGLGYKYNKAFIVVERNNHGHTVLAFLRKRYPTGLLYREQKPLHKKLGYKMPQYGYLQNVKSKAFLVDNLYGFLRDNIMLYSKELIKQLEAYEEQVSPSGVVKYSAPAGEYDDLVTALGLACVGIPVSYTHLTLPTN